MAFTPTMGQSGIYKLRSPYDQLVTPKVVYTCRSLRTLNDVFATGEDPFVTYYKPVGLDEAAYQEDAKTNVVIVGLQAGTGEWIYVPDSYIVQAPNNNGVKYTSIVLGVSLGSIPDDTNLDGLISLFNQIVLANLGVTPTVKGVVVSQPAYISSEQHARLLAARKEKISQADPDPLKIARLEQDLQSAQTKIAELEKWIRVNRYSKPTN